MFTEQFCHYTDTVCAGRRVDTAIASGGRDSLPQPDKPYVAEGKPQNQIVTTVPGVKIKEVTQSHILVLLIYLPTQ